MRRTVLVASTPIPGHTLNATPVVRSLSGAGVRVLWYLDERFADHARRWVDPADVVTIQHTPREENNGGLAQVRRLFRDDVAGRAAEHTDALLHLVQENAVDLVVSDSLMLGAGIATEVATVPWVTFGDGPLLWPDPAIPPFGSGLGLMGGRAGRHRNRTVRRVVDRLVYRDALVGLNETRTQRGLWPLADLATAGVSRHLHLQGCVPSFEYPRLRWPTFVRFVGALGPGPRFGSPVPTPLRRGVRTRPLAFVTQGTLRPDPSELVTPACQALTAEGYDVLAAGTWPGLQGLPGVRVERRVDYEDAVRQADVVVTNGGYTGVTLALAAGTPVVQCGRTEEKSDIGERLEACGAGLSLKTRAPRVPALRRAVRRVTTDPRHREAQRRVAADFAAHDTDALIRAAVLDLVAA